MGVTNVRIMCNRITWYVANLTYSVRKKTYSDTRVTKNVQIKHLL